MKHIVQYVYAVLNTQRKKIKFQRTAPDKKDRKHGLSGFSGKWLVYLLFWILNLDFCEMDKY